MIFRTGSMLGLLFLRRRLVVPSPTGTGSEARTVVA